MSKIVVELTDKQRGILRGLLVQEAKSLGYGTKYSEWERKQWPPRLKALSVIAKKLMPPE